ncbi:probable MST1 - threonine--tRNA ligase, mitochondrial [Melanopsichium pennsylvanicum]|uniref:threonine--tRNA ligase n=2 Tax=Melanopsichium pennsylvanicum TaxID=63383 RepID=A0AAJ4XQC3_9BASI|nr:probable MST1-threonine--tRNA ligase, mitochondrial [Melanopsichium pennsylvanicum 4]SNX85178.1 probable MST1 - threonine--tRNA ligase, mitochondrial [Melanopsichium pennsylvanicum]
MSHPAANMLARTMLRSSRSRLAPSSASLYPLPISALVPAYHPSSTSSKAPSPNSTLAEDTAGSSTDHRSIGKAQSLFLTHDSSPGTPFILPHGMRIARKVERVVRDLYDVYGYDEVQSPQLYKTSLWKRSGHWDNYRDDMFATEGYKDRLARTSSSSSSIPQSSSVSEDRTACCSIHPQEATSMKEGGQDETFGLKPMNCPGHCLIFASQERSYRDLPIRYAEFSPLHRNEASGALTGLTRVRRFHQDDAHVFCRPDQVASEINDMLAMLTSAYDTFGFSSFELVLSTRPVDSYIGSVEEWDRAESGLKVALQASGRKWELNQGDGAFYGPKIDIRLVDGQGRRHQTATIQLDFQLPRRFDLTYADPEAKLTNQRSIPVMIHRAILGSVERFMAILIEQTAGWWPFWLSPRQAIILPAKTDNPALIEYATKIQKYLSLGVNPDSSPATSSERHLQRFFVDIESNPQNEKLSKLVRKAQLARYNYILVVGEREMQTNSVNVRKRDDKNAPQSLTRLAKMDQHTLDNEGKGGQYSVQDLRRMFCQLDSHHTW